MNKYQIKSMTLMSGDHHARQSPGIEKDIGLPTLIPAIEYIDDRCPRLPVKRPLDDITMAQARQTTVHIRQIIGIVYLRP